MDRVFGNGLVASLRDEGVLPICDQVTGAVLLDRVGVDWFLGFSLHQLGGVLGEHG